MDETCSSIQERLPMLMNGTLSSHDIVSTLNHVKGCQQCKLEIVFLLSVRAAASDVWDRQPTPSLTRAVWRNLHEIRDTRLIPTSTQWFRPVVNTLENMAAPLFALRSAYRRVYQSLSDVAELLIDVMALGPIDYPSENG